MRLEGSRAVGCDDAGRARSWRLKELEACVSAEPRAGVFMVILRAHMERLREKFAAKSLVRDKGVLGRYTGIALGYHFYSQIYTSLKPRLNSSESICVMSNQHFHV